MNYGFHLEAQWDYTEAIEYYLGVEASLAENFISEIEHGINVIRRNPLTWRIVEGDVRRYLVHRFPYVIYYTCESDFITIWAVMHLSREQGYCCLAGVRKLRQVSPAFPACMAGGG